MPPHAHGGGEEEEEVVVVRTDGPPFADIKSKLGEGFEVDYEKVSRHLGAGKLSLADFTRDITALNAAYVPTAHRAHVYLKLATVLCVFAPRARARGARRFRMRALSPTRAPPPRPRPRPPRSMLGAFSAFIIMGMIGGTPDVRAVVIPILFVVFLAGVASFYYSKWIEQPGVKAGAVLVKKLIDEDINPRYASSPARIRWTIRVNVAKREAMHLGATFVERPIISIYALRSEDADGRLLDWPLPEAFMTGLLFERKKVEIVDDGTDRGW